MTRSVPLAYAAVLAFTTCILTAFATLAYAAHGQRQADRRWCALFSALDPVGVPPTNPRGQAIATEIQNLRDSFGCR